MFNPNEKETSDLNQGRLMRAESDLIMPMLERQRNSAIARLCAHFRSGQLDQLPVCAAQICSIEDMKSEIKNKIAKAQTLERKILDGTQD